MSDEKVQVEFYGRPVTAQKVAEGVVRRATRKSAKSYLIRCSSTGKWCYCSEDRHDNLIKKHGSDEAIGQNYVSREAKKNARDAAETVES